MFEPPDDHKGDAARAMFYVAAVYGEDAVDAKEKARNDAISTHQENRNPFVDVPALIDRLDDI